MNTKILKLSVPADIFVALNESEQQFLQNMKLFTAVNFFQMKKLTLGKAAGLAGMSRFEFETVLSENQISVSNLDFEDIEKDITELENI